MIPNSYDLSMFKEDIILPLKGYSVGFDVYFDSEEIEKIANKRNVSVLINSFLHKNEIENIKQELEKMPSVKYFFVEDLGLTNIIDRNLIVLFQNHMVSNYESINYFNSIDLKNIVISNELTIDEIDEIKKKTNSNLFYFFINRNMLMYSKRGLISSYNEYKGKELTDGKKEIIENVSKKSLLIKEEDGVTTIFDKNIFSANSYLKELNGLNFIVNFSNMDENETKIILENYDKENLSDYINCDNYFLLNKIIYKVGEKHE